MKKALTVIGVLMIISGIISGIWAGTAFPASLRDTSFNWILMFELIISGVVFAFLFFGPAYIIGQNERILAYQTYVAEQENLRAKSTETIECSSCKKQYESGLSSCPHCGERQEKPYKMKSL